MTKYIRLNTDVQITICPSISVALFVSSEDQVDFPIT